MKIILLFLTILLNLNATITYSDEELKKMIGRMLIVGFSDKYVNENSKIIKDIQKYDLGGVILFDRYYNDRNKTKNISSPKQLQMLTKKLKKLSNKEIFIAIDQEGGKVARLKPQYGFLKIPSAFEISKMGLESAKKTYKAQAKMLHEMGINLNFAPVVDLALNPKNKVIVGLNRSFGSDSEIVSKYAKIVIDEQNKYNIISVLKHFPGHGSSLQDSHKGFVDITTTWNKKELEPYKNLINSKSVDMIMTAHVFNKNLDENYPATLSYKINEELLRQKMKYNGVIISDDMQMNAISKHYSLKEATTLAINSGVDILLFGNQLLHIDVDKIVETIFEAVKSSEIPISRIIESNERIANLHTKNSIVQKPITFKEKRKKMTKEYIKNHYGINAKEISIKPKIIVLHWTALMEFEKCFKRLKPEVLFSDRTDIATASALNVSSHFLVDRDGTIYQLMPDNWMARHVIGLNYNSIGVENVGGEANKKDDLTPAQIEANIRLVRYLKAKYPSISYLIGHHEYREMEKTPLWLEKDDGYRTKKVDPGKRFMSEVRKKLEDLELLKPNE